jgi:hypothetical protein
MQMNSEIEQMMKRGLRYEKKGYDGGGGRGAEVGLIFYITEHLPQQPASAESS